MGRRRPGDAVGGRCDRRRIGEVTAIYLRVAALDFGQAHCGRHHADQDGGNLKFTGSAIVEPCGGRAGANPSHRRGLQPPGFNPEIFYFSIRRKKKGPTGQPVLARAGTVPI